MDYASSSRSSRTSEREYEVFLSFRGEDTREKFVSHLLSKLDDCKIKTFFDDRGIHKGDEISESLLKAIEQSNVAIIVFSENYASSKWCLEELAKIIQGKRSRGLKALPVFYEVDPSEVRNQTGKFGEAFKEYEERFKEELEKVQRWRSALTEACSLCGFDSKNIRPESKLVKEVVRHVLKELNHLSTSNNNNLVGIESRIKDLKSLLCLKSRDVFAIGIWGMGGIGKTTLACATFHEIKRQFEGHYLIENVATESNRVGIPSMQKDFLHEILGDTDATLKSTLTKDRLRHKKVAILLDDVTKFNQKEEIIGNVEHYGAGSRIIITSRNKGVLKECEVDDNKIYKVKELEHDQGLQLFSQYAFKKPEPDEEYMKLSKMIVTHEFIKGIPLALKVFGSMLSMYPKRKWGNVVEKLERKVFNEIEDVLKLSYDELKDEDQREIFLDVACFLKDTFQTDALEILEANGFTPEIEIFELNNKSLITLSSLTISMHDVIQEMGRKIVEKESNDYNKRSRLWHHEDIFHLLKNNMGTEAIKAIHLDTSKISEINLNLHTFLKMCNLRLLDFFPSSTMCISSTPTSKSPDEENKNKVTANQGLDFVCTELRYLRWYGYPLNSLPSNFDPRNLVVLIMPHSNIEELGNVFQRFDKLKIIDLSYSKNLTRILCLSSNLESLILTGCSSLTEIDPSIQYLNKLVMLILTDCKNLEILPTGLLQHSESLVYIFLSGCSNLKMAPKITSSMRYVFLDGTAIEEFPLVEESRGLDRFSLHNCSRLKSLPSTICELLQFEYYLNLSGCSKLERLPDDLGHMESLWVIEAGYTAIREVPSSIVQCKYLRRLSLRGCKGGQELVDSALPLLSCLKSLSYLDLSDCQITNLRDSLGQLSFLERLFLGQNKFEFIPSTIKDLIKLRTLNVSDCTSLQSLPKLPRRVEMQAYNCKSLKALPYFSLEQQFNLANCFELDRHDFKAQVENTLLEFQSNSKLHSESLVGICYPGNEIPEFFNVRSMGSSVTLELPLDGVKERWSDFLSSVVCVVVTFQDPQTIEWSSDSFDVHGRKQRW